MRSVPRRKLTPRILLFPAALASLAAGFTGGCAHPGEGLMLEPMAASSPRLEVQRERAPVRPETDPDESEMERI